MTYQPKVYREQGGDRMVVASGGEIDVETGGQLKSGGQPLPKIAKVALATATGNAGMLSWQNPEAVPIIVTRLVLVITTEATGAATADFGADADGTGTSNTLIDGVDIGAAAGVFDNTVNGGTSGQGAVRLDEAGGTTDWITGTAGADPAGLVGTAYIEYVAA